MPNINRLAGVEPYTNGKEAVSGASKLLVMQLHCIVLDARFVPALDTAVLEPVLP